MLVRECSLETQLSQLTTLVSSLVEQQGEKVESSGFVAAAPGGGGPETSMHISADGLVGPREVRAAMPKA